MKTVLDPTLSHFDGVDARHVRIRRSRRLRLGQSDAPIWTRAAALFASPPLKNRKFLRPMKPRRAVRIGGRVSPPNHSQPRRGNIPVAPRRLRGQWSPCRGGRIQQNLDRITPPCAACQVCKVLREFPGCTSPPGPGLLSSPFAQSNRVCRLLRR